MLGFSPARVEGELLWRNLDSPDQRPVGSRIASGDYGSKQPE
jgi:hypothetical protein